MTVRALIPVDADTLELIARNSGRQIELGQDRGYLTIDGTTFVAEIAPVAEVTC